MAGKGTEKLLQNVERVNSELFTFTYGAIVMQLLKDLEDVDATNQQLEKMGYNIGVRLVDEFFAKTQSDAPSGFREAADMIAKVGFKLFLGIPATLDHWNQDYTEFSLVWGDYAISDFVELPPEYSDLHYGNMLCGVIRGALEMIGMQVDCVFARDKLVGDDSNEMKVTLKEIVG